MKVLKIVVACFFVLSFAAVNLFAADEDKSIFNFINKNDTLALKTAANSKTVNLKGEDDNTPLHYAARESGNPEVIDILIKAGADIEAKNKFGYTPLMLAIRKNTGRPEIALTLIKNKANVNAMVDKPYEDEDKKTPLMYAVSEYMLNDLKVIQALIDAGADVNAKCAVDQNTPLHIAARDMRDPEAINILVKAGAKTEEKNKYGYTPLMLAIRKNASYPLIAIALIKNKADVNNAFEKSYDDEDKTTPLMYAVSEYTQNKPNAIQALADAGANVNAVRPSDGNTPLHIAARYVRDPEVINILTKAGANLEARDKSGYTPLIRALKNDTNPDIAIALIKNKADVNAIQNAEELTTPLMVAFANENISVRPNVIQAMIDFGAKINAKNKDGQTPLMFAAKNSREEALKVLIANKADIAAVDKSGKTANDYAKNNSYLKEKDLNKLK